MEDNNTCKFQVCCCGEGYQCPNCGQSGSCNVKQQECSEKDCCSGQQKQKCCCGEGFECIDCGEEGSDKQECSCRCKNCNTVQTVKCVNVNA